MFAPQHDNPPSLRQGDVIETVFFPLTRPPFLKYLAAFGSGAGTDIKLEPVIDTPQGSRVKYLQSVCHGLVAHGSVLSQCCDLDKRHPKASFSLCRLVPFDRARYRNVDTLVNNIDPWGPENPYFQFFYYGGIDGLPGEWLADFGLLMSLSWSDYEFILRKKVHQLDDPNRNKFRVKVGAFFGRPTEEDRAAGLANPYEPVAPDRPSLLKRLRTIIRF